MSIFDALKKGVIEQFAGSVTVLDMVFSLLLAFILAVFIILVYRKTFSGIVYNKSFTLTTMMLTLVTAMVIRTINSNLFLSLGMVGALSIVRFRTAIKEPLDTAFLFWAIAAGIMSGAGLYFIAILASIVTGLLFYFFFTIDMQEKNQYLLVIMYTYTAESRILAVMDALGTKKLKSKTTSAKGTFELTYEVKVKDTAIINKLQSIDGVLNVSMIELQNDIGL